MIVGAAGMGKSTLAASTLRRRRAVTAQCLEGAGATAPNQVTVPLGAGGKVSFYTLSGTHLIADLAGYYTESTGFTPLTPAATISSSLRRRDLAS